MNEQDIPIDIHVGKLVDWLVSRRHVKREWPDDIRTIREKINKAIQDMPEHPEVTKLLTGTYINYFHCLKIIEILKETEKESKNILGWYGSQRMKDWQEVVRLYQKDNVYLAEAGQLVTRNVNFEIPAIKRQIAKGVQIQTDCDQKYEDLKKGIEASKKQYFKNCKEIGITGDDIKSELLGLLKTLPEEFDSIAEDCKNLLAARQLYSDFLSFTISSHQSDCIPILKFIMEHGNVTTYEWLYGEAPVTVEEPQLLAASHKEAEPSNEGEIDFGDVAVGGEGGGEIDFGNELQTGDIDWGNLEDSSATIDWGIGEGEEVTTAEITLEESGVAGGVAKGNEALTVLHNQSTRNQFIDELYELEGFLNQRACEFEEKGSSYSISMFTNAAASVQDHNIEQVREMLQKVKKVLSRLSTTKMQHLFLISSSPRYVDRLADSLRSKLVIGEKLAESQVAAQKRKQNTIKEQQSLTPKLKLINERTRELQHQISDDISKKYKNRPVNIMGANYSSHK